MKLFILTVALLTAMVGCKAVLNEAKLGAAEKVGQATEKFLNKEFQGEQYAGLACEEEAKEVGEKMQANIEKVLKAQKESPVMAKSIAGDIVKLTCKVAVNQALPLLFKDIAGERYRCSGIALGGHASRLGDKLCEGIDF